MTASDATPTGGQSADDLRAELSRIDAQRDELLREARELRTSLSDEGPLDLEERTAMLTQAEELEALAAELDGRRQTLAQRLGNAT